VRYEEVIGARGKAMGFLHVCEQCGAEFRGVHRFQKYCSWACVVASRKKKD
jgi:hypothetical protein